MVIKGTPADQLDYVDFINYVFGMNGTDSSFVKLLPKLFREGKDSASDTYFIKENGQMRAAVGAFPITFQICGEILPVRGIGNVAVHPRSRGQSYMKACMKAALDGMLAEGCAFSVLSGRRHRYNHFGYVKCGTDRSYSVTAKTLSYIPVLPDEPKLTMRQLTPEDGRSLDAIAALWDTRTAYRALRPRADLYDIMISWESVPMIFYEGDTLAGWAIIKDSHVFEFIPARIELVPSMLRLLSSRWWHLNYHIPLFDKAIAAAIFPYAETQFTGADLCFNILNYEKMLSLLLRLKSTYEPLLDGSTVVEINGFRTIERLRLTVSNGIPSVEPTAETPDAVFSHLEAMRAFFLEDAPDRDKLSPLLRTWLPLPIYIFHADNV